MVNPGKGDFRNIYIELKPRKPEAGDLLQLSERDAMLISNDRVRVVRRVLKPGESSGIHKHPLNGIGIVIYDAKIEISSPGKAASILDAKAGEFAWQTAGMSHSIKNIGTTDFVAIEIEIR